MLWEDIHYSTWEGKSTAAILQLFESHSIELKLYILVQSFLLNFLFVNESS